MLKMRMTHTPRNTRSKLWNPSLPHRVMEYFDTLKVKKLLCCIGSTFTVQKLKDKTICQLDANHHNITHWTATGTLSYSTVEFILNVSTELE